MKSYVEVEELSDEESTPYARGRSTASSSPTSRQAPARAASQTSSPPIFYYEGKALERGWASQLAKKSYSLYSEKVGGEYTSALAKRPPRPHCNRNRTGTAPHDTALRPHKHMSGIVTATLPTSTGAHIQGICRPKAP